MVAGMLLLRPSLEKIDVDRSVPPAQNDAVPQALTKTFSEESGAYSIQVEYPELQGIAVSGVREKVNGRIKTSVYNQVAGFRANSASILPSGDLEPKSAFDGRFEVSLLTKLAFSALMSYSDYSAGAAHPNSYNMALNYDLKTGEPLTLEKVLGALGPSAGYMERLGKYVKDDLFRQFGSTEDSLSFIESGAAPSGESYANFTLDSRGLAIHFDPYQVAPYAAGSPTVEIPHGDLISKIVKPADAAATSTAQWWLQ